MLLELGYNRPWTQLMFVVELIEHFIFRQYTFLTRSFNT